VSIYDRQIRQFVINTDIFSFVVVRKTLQSVHGKLTVHTFHIVGLKKEE